MTDVVIVKAILQQDEAGVSTAAAAHIELGH